MNHIVITNPEWIKNIKKAYDESENFQKESGLEMIKFIKEKYGKKTMDEEQEKYIVDELNAKIKTLENRKRNLTLQNGKFWQPALGCDK